MPEGRRFVLTGLSRLSVRVAQILVRRNAEVIVVAPEGDSELLRALPPDTKQIAESGPWVDLLRSASAGDCDCILVLSESDFENLQVAAAASDVAPDVPLVLRAFDARLVEQFQSGQNVRRCFSASVLAAAAFVAAALGEEVVETLRLDDAEVALCLLTVSEDSPLIGRTAGEVKSDWACASIARAQAGREWAPARGDQFLITQGDELLVGGLLSDVLRLAQSNGHELWSASGSHRLLPWQGRRRARSLGRSLLPIAATALATLLALTVVVFALALNLDPDDAMYKAITNAFGDVQLSAAPTWLKMFGLAAMVGGAVLVGAVLSHATARITAARLEEQASRRARQMRGHVIVAGLGWLGFRVDRLLSELGIPTVIIEQTEPTRFREAAAFRTPVLAGDARLAENLERAGVRHAACIIACTDDDLTNFTACVQAEQLNPSIRTIARIFDEDLCDRLAAFAIDVPLSAASAAASAFVGAATDERAIRRVELPGLDVIALRCDIDRVVSAEEVQRWRDDGLRILAVQEADGEPLPPSAAADGLRAESVIIAAGPEVVLRRCVFGGAG